MTRGPRHWWRVFLLILAGGTIAPAIAAESDELPKCVTMSDADAAAIAWPMGADIALLFGNNYRPQMGGIKVLNNAIRDARGVGGVLKTRGFKVVCIQDASMATMNKAIKAFRRALDDNRRAGRNPQSVVYFAGHGGMSDGREQEVITADRRRLSVKQFVSLVPGDEQYFATIVIVDACRTKLGPEVRLVPLRASSIGAHDFDNSPPLALVLTTDAGDVAGDGPLGGNGPFLSMLRNYVDGGSWSNPIDLRIGDLIANVGQGLERAGSTQVPVHYLTGRFAGRPVFLWELHGKWDPSIERNKLWEYWYDLFNPRMGEDFWCNRYGVLRQEIEAMDPSVSWREAALEGLAKAYSTRNRAVPSYCRELDAYTSAQFRADKAMLMPVSYVSYSTRAAANNARLGPIVRARAQVPIVTIKSAIPGDPSLAMGAAEFNRRRFRVNCEASDCQGQDVWVQSADGEIAGFVNLSQIEEGRTSVVSHAVPLDPETGLIAYNHWRKLARDLESGSNDNGSVQSIKLALVRMPGLSSAPEVKTRRFENLTDRLNDRLVPAIESLSQAPGKGYIDDWRSGEEAQWVLRLGQCIRGVRSKAFPGNDCLLIEVTREY